MAQQFILFVGLAGIIAMIWGGRRQIRDRGDRQKGYLMFGVAAVIAANMLIALWPV